MEAVNVAWRPLGRLLVEQGLLTEEELEHALDEQASTGRRLGDTLVDLGFVSRPALSRALADQYGIELAAESGFGTGLRLVIERRHHEGRGTDVPDDASVPANRQPLTAEQVADAAETLHLAQLEENWARLAAAEERLAIVERELAERDRRIAELSAAAATNRAAPARAHLLFAYSDGRYVLVERDGPAPQPGAPVEVAEGRMVVEHVGRSPFPDDDRPCAFVVEPSRQPTD